MAVDINSVIGIITGMDDLELIRKRLEDIPVSELSALAERCHVPFGTLQKIKYGKTKNPRFDTVKQLTEYFAEQEAA